MREDLFFRLQAVRQRMFGIPTPMIIGVVLLFLWYVYLFTDTIGARILRMLAELEDEGFKHFRNTFAVFFPVNGLLTILMGVAELARPYGWFEKEGLLKELLTVVFYLLVFIGYPLSFPGKRFRPEWLYPEYHEAARAERKKGAEMMKSQTIPAPAPPPAPAPDPLDIEDLDPFSMEARQARRLESLRNTSGVRRRAHVPRGWSGSRGVPGLGALRILGLPAQRADSVPASVAGDLPRVQVHCPFPAQARRCSLLPWRSCRRSGTRVAKGTS